MIGISYRICWLNFESPSTTRLLLSNAARRSSFHSRSSCRSNNRNLLSGSSSTTTSLVDSNSCLSSLSLSPLTKATTTTSLINKIRHNHHLSSAILCKKFYCPLPSLEQYKNLHHLHSKPHNKIFLIRKTASNCRPFSLNGQISSPSISNSGNPQNQMKTMAQIISGKAVADEIRAKLKTRVEGLKFKPRLAIVQVGGREDSNVYIKMKIQFAESIGASAELIKLAKEISEADLAQKVKELNADPSVHGIITQLPFDAVDRIDSDKIVNLIDPKKDVDGLCVYNAGKLLHGELNSSAFVACTPNGCMELIKKSGIKLEGTRSVVIGRSKIVGSPMAQLLLWHNSTVTICHSRTKGLDEICRQADIVVAAVGRAQMVKRDWLKPGAVVIDCGINVIPDSTKKSGTRLVGDVDFDECKEVAGAITPVPGGVGPMTVAMLISNTVEAASRAEQAKAHE